MKEVQKICKILNRTHKTLLAGGCVRDLFLGIEPKDYDFATTATPKEVIAIYRKEGYQVVPTGIDHGTVTVVGKRPYEITTLRIDNECDGRHASVEFTTNFRIDAMRRDLTINAMFLDPITNQVYDYMEGGKDLKDKVLRFVGNASDRIEEDALRILRIFRFFSRFDKFNICPENLTALNEKKHLLKNISRERIRDEFVKILQGRNSIKALKIMHELNIFDEIFETMETTQEDFLKINALVRIFEKGYNKLPDTSLLLALFFKNEFLEDLKSLKLDRNTFNNTIYYIKNYEKLKSTDIVELRRAYVKNPDNFRNMTWMYLVNKLEGEMPYFNIVDTTPIDKYFTPPLNGDEIMGYFPHVAPPQIGVLKQKAHDLLFADKITYETPKRKIVEMLKEQK